MVKQQHGKDETGNELENTLEGGSAVNFVHDVHQAPHGSGGKQGGHKHARHQHGVGLVGVQIVQIVLENGQNLLGQHVAGLLQQRGHLQVELGDKGGDADENGEKGQEQKIGQFGGGAADPVDKIQLHHVCHKSHGRNLPSILPQAFHGKSPPFVPKKLLLSITQDEKAGQREFCLTSFRLPLLTWW